MELVLLDYFCTNYYYYYYYSIPQGATNQMSVWRPIILQAAVRSRLPFRYHPQKRFRRPRSSVLLLLSAGVVD